MTEKLPEYLKEQSDGSIEITLTKAREINGTRVQTLTMREPTVEDQLIAQETTKSNARAEVLVIANLCEVSPSDISGMTLRDYGRAAQAYSYFS